MGKGISTTNWLLNDCKDNDTEKKTENISRMLDHQSEVKSKQTDTTLKLF